jgi:hypothetical protein
MILFCKWEKTMQITAELDSQHLEKLHELEQSLRKTTSELISLAIDEIYKLRKVSTEVNEGQRAYELMQQSGFIGGFSDDEDLSETYKNHLDWSHKI